MQDDGVEYLDNGEDMVRALHLGLNYKGNIPRREDTSVRINEGTDINPP